MKKWHTMPEPNQTVMFGLIGLDLFLLFLTLINGFYFLLFLIGVAVVVWYAPLGFRRKIFQFMRVVGIVRYLRDKQQRSYLDNWPKVTYRVTNELKSFRIYGISFENDDRLPKIIENVFGMRLKRLTTNHGYYQFDLVPEAEVKHYDF